MQVTMSPLQAIQMTHSLKYQIERTVAHYSEKGCPGFIKAVSRDHLEGMYDGHALMLAALRAEGYPMRDDDLLMPDMDELFSRPWVHSDEKVA